MSQINMVGDEYGIRLWELMSKSADTEEQAYFQRLNTAASQYGKVYFTDVVTQRETKKNQTTWELIWDGTNSRWNVSAFLIPSGVDKISDRLKDDVVEIEVDDGEWEDIDPDDIISI